MNTDQTIKFYIGDIPIHNPIMLAPMDGFTDLPFRSIAKSFGAGIVFSEFINGLDVVNQHPYLQQLTEFSDSERIFAYQIFDDSPQRILETALILQEKQPDFIDINMGCSAKNVSSRGAGAGLLKTPEKIETIFQLLTSNLKIPVTGKIRLGWDDDHLNYLENSKNLGRQWCCHDHSAWSHKTTGLFGIGRLEKNLRSKTGRKNSCHRKWRHSKSR